MSAVRIRPAPPSRQWEEKTASDLAPDANTALIEAYFKFLAPGIPEASCGTTLIGDYQVCFQLEPNSTIKFLDISKDEYSDDHLWKDKIRKALEDANVFSK